MMRQLRVGVDSYSLNPRRMSPFEILDWAKRHGAEGVHFSELYLKDNERVDDTLLRDLGQQARALGLYLEWGGGQHVPFDTTTWQRKELLSINADAARQASLVGACVLRSCSGGLFRWSDASPPTEALLREMARALREHRPVLSDLGVVLAIELHFEFTTFELRRLFDMCAAEPGGWLGVCLDTMNVLTMLEDPVSGTERILPWVVAVHAKDGALLPTPEGLLSFTAEIGAGLVDFDRIIARLATLERPVHLSVEDHGGSFPIPIYEPSFLSRFPDLTTLELARLMQLADAGRRAVADGRLAITERADWPQLCEARVARDIAQLQSIARRVAEPFASGPAKPRCAD